MALVEMLLPGDLPPELWLHATRLRALWTIAHWAGLIEAACQGGPVHAASVRHVRGGKQGRPHNTLVHDAIRGLRTLWLQSPGSRQKTAKDEFEFVWRVVQSTAWKGGVADAPTRRKELRRLFRDPRCSTHDSALAERIASGRMTQIESDNAERERIERK